MQLWQTPKVHFTQCQGVKIHNKALTVFSDILEQERTRKCQCKTKPFPGIAFVMQCQETSKTRPSLTPAHSSSHELRADLKRKLQFLEFVYTAVRPDPVFQERRLSLRNLLCYKRKHLNESLITTVTCCRIAETKAAMYNCTQPRWGAEKSLPNRSRSCWL